jgi:amidophosphoribosyltransferase
MEKQHNHWTRWCWFASINLIWNQVKDILVECDQIMLNQSKMCFAQINDRVNEEMAAPEYADNVTLQKANIPYVGELF